MSETPGSRERSSRPTAGSTTGRPSSAPPASTARPPERSPPIKFTDLPLTAPIRQAVADQGYHTATPIQARTIPAILEGRDVLGCAQTGTGKTAAFALPMLNRLAEARRPKGRRQPRALVLAPTRELAHQIADSFQTYGKGVEVFGTVIYGGVGQGKQVQALRRGVDIVVATPGRLLDLINQGHCDLSHVRCCVLDEADRMLDMGFMPDIKRIIDHMPNRQQTLLFSATMPPAIRRFADSLLHNPEEVTLAPESPAAERIAQSVYHVDKPKKQDLLKHLIDTLAVTRAIVFTRTKHSADRVAKQLARAGTRAEAIHGNKSQNARQRTLDGFRNGKLPVLVATDIAARGIDVDDISHVFNFDIARDPESHVHRIGRTARAGAEGAAITFCDRDELPHLRAVERLINMKLEVQGDQPAPPEPRRQRGNGKPAGNKPNPSGKPRRRQPAAKNAARRGPNSANGRPNRGGQRGKRAPR